MCSLKIIASNADFNHIEGRRRALRSNSVPESSRKPFGRTFHLSLTQLCKLTLLNSEGNKKV